MGLGGVLVLVALAAIGVTTASGAKSASPIIVGFAADLSGQMAPFDNPALTAARLEAKKINAHGGVLGRKLEVISCDTQNSKPDVSKSCVDNVVPKGAVVGMVTCDVDFATAAIQEFLSKGMLTIAPCIGTDQMGPKRFGADGKLAFSYGNVAQDEGAAMAEYAYNVKRLEDGNHGHEQPARLLQERHPGVHVAFQAARRLDRRHGELHVLPEPGSGRRQPRERAQGRDDRDQ